MEEEEEQPLTPAQPSSPFWLQTTTRSSRLRTAFGIVVLNTTFLVLLLSISAIAFLSIQTPSLLLFAQRVLRPSSVKRGWDSLNLLLVLFAVVCGFLGRKDDQDRSSIDDAHVQGSIDAATPRSVISEQPSNWYNYGLRRSFRSYPDLRQEMLFQYDPRPRSYDDSYVRSPRFLTSLETSRSQKVDDRQEKNDGFYGKKLPSEDSAPAKSPQEPPPPPPSDNLSSEVQTKQESPPTIRRKSRRTRRSEPREAQSPQPARTTSPLPSSAVVQQALEEQSATSTPKKRGGMTKELISSIYHQSKRKKKQRRRSHENLEEFDQITNPNPSFHAPSPPPPPPPPPPTRFHNIFSTKKGKSGKQSSSAPPNPPPPPPRRRSIDRIILKSSSSVTSKANANRTKLDLMEQIAGEGSDSPLTRIPPPPPPPPFKFRSWKFAVEGDYVKIASSGGGESEIEESDTGTPVAGENTPSLLTCPSPDVNLKADDFIARFRSKLKLEKLNSIKQKQEMGSGFSPLGPESSPSPN